MEALCSLSKCSTTTRYRDSKEKKQLNCISYLILWHQSKFHLVSCAVALVQTASCTFSSDLNLNCILYLTNNFSQTCMLYLILWPQFTLCLVRLYCDLSLNFVLFSILCPQSTLYPMTSIKMIGTFLTKAKLELLHCTLSLEFQDK
jgi:hypothetical protein